MQTEFCSSKIADASSVPSFAPTLAPTSQGASYYAYCLLKNLPNFAVYNRKRYKLEQIFTNQLSFQVPLTLPTFFKAPELAEWEPIVVVIQMSELKLGLQTQVATLSKELLAFHEWNQKNETNHKKHEMLPAMSGTYSLESTSVFCQFMTHFRLK